MLIPRFHNFTEITTEEAMYKLDMFQSIFGKVDKLGWWDMEIIQPDYGMPKEFQ